ncbi:RimK family protein [Pseudoalteromonas spongiae]|uniref:RimK family protein n=1 Tax=Pseudoalteromonas spongiae TaxID=298657 RepID=UPI00026C909C|nr:RimK family protein [Pseudoalteromonas spongiae]ATD00422.1 hypothetical protein PSPO_b0378 [Pseudoalteromonas spongiae UST010723-006]
MVKTLIVVDDTQTTSHNDIKAIDFATYLKDYPKRDEPKTRVINLCESSRYLSQGYYCSLLAEARGHDVLPSVKTLNNLRTPAQILVSRKYLDKTVCNDGETCSVLMCFGRVQDEKMQKLAALVYQEYPVPVLRVAIKCDLEQLTLTIEMLSFSVLSDTEKEFFNSVVSELANTAWKKRQGIKKMRWDVAMLVNQQEASAPSNKGALSRFIKAGEKLGIAVHIVEASSGVNLAHYDGLFIRETTGIDHHTYRLAQHAEKLGLVVMDDPTSILRCCNKVFLHDAFNYQKVPSLKTHILADQSPDTIAMLESSFGYPLVLKMPEGSFSKGVFKVKTREELKTRLAELFAESALVLAQEFMFTDYDWRIGVINGRALYACRYYMARNHWQIYNHKSKRNFSGAFDSLPTFEVPKAVLSSALKAAAVIGDGFYGIDIKEVDGKAFVLEVNDNPSIDHGVEDKYLGEELYMQIMSEFLRRLESRGK